MKVYISIISVAVFAATATAEPLKVRRPLGLIEPDIPIAQPLTEEKVSLGRKLFFDSRLSRTKSTSCATCHDPAFGYAEPRQTSVTDGGIVQRRNAPSLYNVGYLPSLMWDGRFKSLEAQALDPFSRMGDMGQEVMDALEIIVRDPEYIELFRRAFNESPTADLMAIALASFERTLVAGDSRFDLYLFGGQESALSTQEKRGLEIFSTRAGCLNCHDVFHPRFNALGGGVALFSDFRFHNLGVGFAYGRFSDAGRYLWSRDPQEWGTFRTPMLRNLTLTAPYMHDGSLQTLDEVVAFYDRGGNHNPSISPSIHPLYLSESEKSDLVSFLKSLTSPDAASLAERARAVRDPPVAENR